jgi:transposase
VTDDSTDGRPWPIDPIRPSTPAASPLAVPELAPGDDPLGSLTEFASAVDGAVNGAANGTAHRAANGDRHRDAPPLPPEASPPTVGVDGPAVSDYDRTRYGLLLDRAAERGLLRAYDYQVKLGELAEATTIDQMKTIVTDFPALTTPPTVPRPTGSKRSSAAVPPVVDLAAAGGRRRSSPWVLLGVLVFVVLASIVFFYLYAEHLVHTRGAGVLISAVAARALSALRL